MDQKKTFFFSVLFLVIFLLLLVWLPFISTVVLAMIFAAVLYPLYERILKLFRGLKSAASLTAVAVVIIVVLIPLVLIGTSVAMDTPSWMHGIPGYLDKPPAGIQKLLKSSDKYFHVSGTTIRKEVLNQMNNIQAYVLKMSASIMSNTIKLTLNILVFLVSLFYFFRDGPELVGLFKKTVPMPECQSERIISRVGSMSRSAVRGMLLNSLAVACISFPGFMITGLPVAVWCLAVAIGILIPVIGSFTVWTSAALVLLFTSGLKPALFIACYGVVVIGVCDNILGPYLMKGSNEISPIWILFSILGGIQLIGIAGILIGPVIFAAAMSFIEVYKEEFIS